jgi:hypothetical protein
MLLLALVALGPLVEERLTRQFVGTAARYASSSIIPETWPVRLSHWVNVFWPAIRPHLLLGVRPSIAADPTLAWSSTESLYLLLLYRGGLMLLAAFVVFAVLVLRKAFSLRHSADDMTRALAQGVIVIMIVNLVIDVLDAHFFMAGEPECIAMVLAMLTAAARHPDVTIRKPDFKVYRERVGAR